MDWIVLNSCKVGTVEIAELVELVKMAEKLSFWLSGLKWVKFVYIQGV